MAQYVATSTTILAGTAWTGTAPGGTTTPSGTISSASNLTSFLQSVNLSFSADPQENTTFGSGGVVSKLMGLKSGDTFTIEGFQDFAAGGIDDLIWNTLGGVGALVYWDVKATSASRAATNPSYVVAAYIATYPPFAASVGEAAPVSITLEVTGQFARLTS